MTSSTQGGAGELLLASAFKLSCEAQFDLATKIASNVGYVLVGEPSFDNLDDDPAPPKPAPDAMREALEYDPPGQCFRLGYKHTLNHKCERPWCHKHKRCIALSAPVPSPDGAAEGSYRCDKRNCFFPECSCPRPPPSDDVRSALADDIKLIGTALSLGDHPGGVSQAFYRMSAALRSAPVSAPANIETIAHIVDPHAFVIPNSKRPDTQDRQAAARGKAKAILAWCAPAVGVTREAMIAAVKQEIARRTAGLLYMPRPLDERIVDAILALSPAPDATVSEPEVADEIATDQLAWLQERATEQKKEWAEHATRGEWQIVPKEPTKEMIQACIWALDRWREINGNVQGFVPPGEKYQVRWRAMLAAAPTSPQDVGREVTGSARDAVIEATAKIAQQFDLDMSQSQLDDRDIELIKQGANTASAAIEAAIRSLASRARA